MQEITRIHLAGTPYNVELPAKKELETYIEAITRSLHADADTMREIELRMSELLQERGVKQDGVIGKEDVSFLQKQLGQPSDFADETEGENAHDTPKTSTDIPKKRLMRDPSNAMIGGVCSGVAAYFGRDVVWVRIATAVLVLLTSGFMIPLYIILWIVMPEAKSAADRLEMTGSPVTLSAIKSTAQDVVVKGEPVLVKILRSIVGSVFAAGALAAMTAVVAVVAIMTGYRHDLMIRENMNWLPISIGLMSIAGLMLSVLFGLIAYLCFRVKAGRSLVIALVLTTLLGAVSFATGAAYTVTNIDDFRHRINAADKTVAYDTKGVLDANVKKIQVTLPQTDIRYVVTSGNPEMRDGYKTILQTKPELQLRRDGDTLVITGDQAITLPCSTMFIAANCAGSTKIFIYGPVLDAVKVDQASFAYQTDAQDALKLDADGDGFISLKSTSKIGVLDASIRSDVVFDARDASIGAANVQIQNQPQITFYKLDKLVLQSDGTCSADNGKTAEINAPMTGDVTYNGEQKTNNFSFECTAVRIKTPADATSLYREDGSFRG